MDPLPQPVVVETATFFEERRALGDREQFRTILKRKGGEPPREGDEVD